MQRITPDYSKMIQQTPLGRSNGAISKTVEQQNKQTEQSTNTAPVLEEKIKEAGTNISGVHLKLSKDALQAIREKSTAEYNKIVDTASAKTSALGQDVMKQFRTSALSQDVMKQFRTSALNQAGISVLAQANSSTQAVLSLLS